MNGLKMADWMKHHLKLADHLINEWNELLYASGVGRFEKLLSSYREIGQHFGLQTDDHSVEILFHSWLQYGLLVR